MKSMMIIDTWPRYHSKTQKESEWVVWNCLLGKIIKVIIIILQKEKEQYHYCLFSNYRAVHTECDTIQKFKMLMKRGVLNGI
jgi:hypothetical protein